MRAFGLVLIAPLTLALAGCELIAAVDHDLIGSGGSGAGPSTGGAGGSGGAGAGPVGGEGGTPVVGGMGGEGGSGGAPECTTPERCPNPPACQTVACNNENCEPGDDVADGTACEISAGVDGVCFVGTAAAGDGSCVECLVNGDCTGPDTCDTTTHQCEGPLCSNGVQNAGETGIDCGGPSCGACDNTQGCAVATDCISGFCNLLQCDPCTMNGQCAGNEWCDTALDGGTCVPKKADGQSCAAGADGECTNGQCETTSAGTSMCCNVDCGDACESCANVDTGGTNGVCAAVTNGTDLQGDCPDLECTTGLCQAGACAVEPATTDCGTGPACAGDSLKPQDQCNGTTSACVAGTPAPCPAFYSCNPTPNPDVCFATCAVQGDCAAGAYCGGVDGTSPPANVCADKKIAGGACLVALECENNGCTANLCD